MFRRMGTAKIIYYIPVFGQTFSGMLFFDGMIAVYIIMKFILKKRNLYFLDSTLLSRIIGCTSDYLVVFAFMAAERSSMGEWMPLF